ncbi:hypothetical protein GCM10009826_19750 [Humibacillus xanthopallidus]
MHTNATSDQIDSPLSEKPGDVATTRIVNQAMLVTRASAANDHVASMARISPALMRPRIHPKRVV